MNIQEKSGITMIALVVTIIIVLILAGITIGTLTGENGIINQAISAKEQAEIQGEQDTVQEAAMTAMNNNKYGELIDIDLQNELNNILGEGVAKVTGTKNLKVTFIDCQHKYNVTSSGNVSTYEVATPTAVWAAVCSTNKTLVFSNNEEDITTYLATNGPALEGCEATEITNEIYSDSDSDWNLPFWRDYANKVENADFLNLVVPKSTAYWFTELYKLSTIKNISNLNTSNVTDMSMMFYYCNNLENIDLSNFDTSKVTNMRRMFDCCYSLENLNISGFETSKVTDMSSMFYNCMSLRNIDLNELDTSKVTDMSYMFGSSDDYGGILDNFDFSNFDTSSVINMKGMFAGANTTTNELDLSSFDTHNVTDMSYMFNGCVLKGLDLSNWDTSSVTDLSCMFYYCRVDNHLDLSSFDTSSVTDMSCMFYYCRIGGLLDLSSFNTSLVTDMKYMFYYCMIDNLLDLSSFDTSSVTNMSCMFTQSTVRIINLSSFNTASVTNMDSMFTRCLELETIYASEDFVTDNVVNSNGEGIFCNCNVLKR